MKNALIYFQPNNSVPEELEINYIKTFITHLSSDISVREVLFENNLNNYETLNIILNKSIEKIDIILLNKPIEDEFYSIILDKVAKKNLIKVDYF